MSEKRFVVDMTVVPHKICDTAKEEYLELYDVVELLNEQQATIDKQDEEIKKLKKTERSWRKIHCCNKESNNCGILIEQQDTIKQLKEENEQLRQELQKKQEEEKLYANEIVKLNKEAKEVLNFKELGGDY